MDRETRIELADRYLPECCRNARHVRHESKAVRKYRGLVCAFQRILGATIFFGTNTQTQKALVTHHARLTSCEARIWYTRDPNQGLLPGGLENETVLSDEFFRPSMPNFF